MRPPSDQSAANTTVLVPTGHLRPIRCPKPAATLKGSHLITENKPLTQNSMASILALPAPLRIPANPALNVPTPPRVTTYVMPLGRSVPPSTQPRPKIK